MEDYLPLAYLNAWEYCPRRFYWEYVLGEMADNEHVILGRHLHRNIDQPGSLQRGETQIHQQQWVWSDRLRVSGIIDAVEDTAGVLTPVEYKKGKMGRYLNDHFQLCAAALCIEERMGRKVEEGEIFYHGNRRRERVVFSTQLRQATEQAIAAAHRALTGPMPAPIDRAEKCRACSLQGICLPREIKHLRQERVINGGSICDATGRGAE